MLCKVVGCNRKVWSRLSDGFCRTDYLSIHDPDVLARSRTASQKQYKLGKQERIRYASEWKKSNPDRVKLSERKSAHIRRASKANSAVYDDVQLNILREIYDDTCYLCDTIVVDGDPKLMPTHDHVIPLSKGGNHSYENAGLAHKSCNSAKGNKLLGSI